MRSAASSPCGRKPGGATLVALALKTKLKITICAAPVPMPWSTALVDWLKGVLGEVACALAFESVVSAARFMLPLVIDPAPVSLPVRAPSATDAFPLPSLTIVWAPIRSTSSVRNQALLAAAVTEKVIEKFPVKFWVVVPGARSKRRSAETTAA